RFGDVIGSFRVGDVGSDQILIFGAQIDAFPDQFDSCVKKTFQLHGRSPFALPCARYIPFLPQPNKFIIGHLKAANETKYVVILAKIKTKLCQAFDQVSLLTYFPATRLLFYWTG